MHLQSLSHFFLTTRRAVLPRHFVLSLLVAVTALAVACTSTANDDPGSDLPTATPINARSTAVVDTPATQTTGTPARSTATSAGTPVATSSPGNPVAGVIPVPPGRDLYELAGRLTLHTSQPIPRFASPAPGPLNKGDQFDWQVSRANGTVTVSAEVHHVSENAYWVFEDGFEPDQGRLSQAARQFESKIWPGVSDSLGPVWSPGIDNDTRIVIFHGVLRPGVAGYFSGIDEYPILIQPDSNQRETIYISANLLTLGGVAYQSTLAHELQHAVHWAADAGEESWVNEGLAEVASGLAGFPPDSVGSFLRKPNTSLVQWEPEIFEASPNYGAAALFFEYVSAHYGGQETLRKIVEHPEDGLRSIDAVLRELGFTQTAAGLFADWIVANFADDESGIFAHPERQIVTPRSDSVSANENISDSVRPFGTNYYVVENADQEVSIEFTGAVSGQIFPAEPHSGETCWWANAGDSIDTKLTRTIDLRNVDSATFKYWTWYAIEEDWDYAYIVASANGGSTWQILASDRSSFENPNGTAFGPGLTGLSGGWVEDEIDLSEFAGSELILQIEYITDDAIHDRGACFDDFSIPEIGWSDSTDDSGGWISAGFALINDRLPVEYLVQVIHDTQGDNAEVERVLVGTDGKATATVRGTEDGEQLVIAVSVITPDVAGSLDYTIDFNTP